MRGPRFWAWSPVPPLSSPTPLVRSAKIPSCCPSLQSFDTGVMHATLRARSDTGSLKARKLRENKKVPCILMGGLNDEADPDFYLLTLDMKELMAEMRKRGPCFENTLYELYVEGQLVPDKVLIRDLEINPGMLPSRVAAVVALGCTAARSRSI